MADAPHLHELPEEFLGRFPEPFAGDDARAAAVRVMAAVADRCDPCTRAVLRDVAREHAHTAEPITVETSPVDVVGVGAAELRSVDVGGTLTLAERLLADMVWSAAVLIRGHAERSGVPASALLATARHDLFMPWATSEARRDSIELVTSLVATVTKGGYEQQVALNAAQAIEPALRITDVEGIHKTLMLTVEFAVLTAATLANLQPVRLSGGAQGAEPGAGS